MTINSEVRAAGPFEGNDVATSFPFEFKVFADSEVLVVRDLAGVELVLDLGTDYTVALNADQDSAPGGSVDLPVPLPVGYTLSMTSALAPLQPVDLTNQGGFYPRVINASLDRLTILVQQLSERLGRTLAVPLSDGELGGTLPSANDRKGTVLAFNEVTGAPQVGPTIAAVGTVAANAGSVNTVANNIGGVNTVAANVADVTNFADVYYGPSANDPTLRRDGSPLQVGDLYFNTAIDSLRSYNGMVWRGVPNGAITVQNLSGDGIETEFLLDYAPENEAVTSVFISGVYQQKNTYELGGAGGAWLIFDEAPPAGANNIEVVVSELQPSDDKLRQDLANPDKGAGIVGFDKSVYYPDQTTGGAISNALSGKEYVESFRTPGLSDSNTIRAALDYIESNLVGKMTILVFEASREYVYDRTAELRTINNLIIDLNGATLKRAPATATKTTLAQAAGTGQSSLYLTSIPSNWEVGDFLAAYVNNTDAGVSHNTCRITAIVRAENRVNISTGFGNFGGYTATIPAGTTIAKKFSAFAGRPSNTEANIPTPGGVNYNVHIINGVINGNAANQENNSWYFNSEIFLHGRHSSIRNMGFANTAGECIVGHGVRVDGCTFRGLKGSCFHLSMHDESWASASASWFTNNFVDRVNLATQAVNGHCEGAITFSWGAGRLIITGNEFSNGTESVLGALGPATEAENPDKWLIFSHNLCRNFERLFYAISAPAEGIVVTDNILVDCESSTFQMAVLLTGRSNIVGGNSCIGNSAVFGAYRATSAVFGSATSTIDSLSLLAGEDVPGFDKGRMYGVVLSAVMHPTRAFRAYATGAAGEAGDTFYSPGGSYAGEFYRQWIPATRRYELFGNVEGGGVRVVIKSATLNLDHTQTHVNNAAALASGMVVGDVYATPTGQLMRVFTP